MVIRVSLGGHLWYKMRRFPGIAPEALNPHTCRHDDLGAFDLRVAGWSLGYVEAQPDLSRNYHVPSQHARYAEGRCALRSPNPLLESENG
ncbi:protein of unknown function [Pseudomonas sp. JV241A]|nr:protein of unknown function [Pseudomonas sp. JV241A]